MSDNKQTNENQKARVSELDTVFCSLKSLTPGRWRRPYNASPHVWEDESGNRCIVGYMIGFVTLRYADGTQSGCHSYEEPFKSALKRNPNFRRAGLAAARRIFSANHKLNDCENTN